MNYKNKFGKCPYCGSDLSPVYGTEDEFIIKNSHLIKTGRKRRIVAYLQCEACFKKQCVDDSFDGPWYIPSKEY